MPPAIFPSPPAPGLPTAGPQASGGPGAPTSGLTDLFGTRTHEHLREAFIRDAAAARLLVSFARLAELEGHPTVATALREMAETVELIASGHLDFLRRVGDPLTNRAIGETAWNLAALHAATSLELQEHLPEYARTAAAEGFPDIASWFESVAHSRRAHLPRLSPPVAVEG